jgi:hypothetical protein
VCSQDLERVLTSFSVSSETTKRSNLAAGRAEHKKSQRDAKVAQRSTSVITVIIEDRRPEHPEA